jgi:uncharacterized repeat protein (TIGR03803 family)
MKKIKVLSLVAAVICCLVLSLPAHAQQALWGAYPDAFYNTGTSSVTNTYQEVLKDVNLGSWAGSIETLPDNTVYGVTNNAVIFKYIPGNAKPSLVFRSDAVSSIGITRIDYDAGYIYGNCVTSGISSIYRMRLDGTDFTILRGDDGSGHGAYGLQLQIDDKLYGLRQPSASGYQIYFSMNTDGTGYTEIRNFPDPTQRPSALFHKPGSPGFVVLSHTGGSCGRGAVFGLSIDGAQYYKSIDFRGPDFNCGGAGGPDEEVAISDGENPINVAFSHEDFQQTYILTEFGGPGENGKLVSLAPDGFSEILNFGYGTRPEGALVVLPDGKVIGLCGVQDDFSGKVFSHDPRTQVNEFDIILNFETPPQRVALPTDIALGADGRIYGTSFWAAFQNLDRGTIFSFESDGTDLQRHYYFENNFGPNGIVYQDSTLFGMFRNSVAIPVPGETGYTTGAVFRYDDGGLENIYVFPQFEADSTKLTAGNDGYLYGVNAPRQFIIKVKSDGTDNQRTSLPAFKSDAPLSVTTSGIYGTSYGSDTHPDGFLYKVRPDFSGIDIIYTFSSATGSKPRGKVVESGGYLYGLTSSGGSSGNGVVFKVQANGSGYTVLHHFDGTNGAKPYGGLTLTSGATGTFHGMTSAGGTNNTGVIFRINDDGSGFQKVYNFSTFSGGSPKGDFAHAPGSSLYALTSTGGAYGHGALFAFSTSTATYNKFKDYDRAPLQDLVLVPGQVGPLSHLVTPEDGALNVSSNPEIELHPVPDATQYILELSTDQDFSCCVLKKTLTTNKGTFEGLEYNTTYYAQVKTDISPSYGTMTSFTTSAPDEDAYVTTPADSAEHIAINNLAVTANLVSGATTYTIELNTSSDFTGTSIVETSSAPGERTLIFNGLGNVTRYYTRVHTDLSPAWGPTTTFTTIGAESYVIDPEEGETNVNYTTTFQLQPVPGASRYYIVLDFERTNGQTGTQTIDGDSPTIGLSGLAYSAEYKARVKTDVNPNYGPVRTFYTHDSSIDTYVTSPADGAVNVPTTVEVASSIVDAEFYTIELNTSADFTGTSFLWESDEPYIFKHTFTGLSTSTTYYSRVKTELSPDWGPTRSFTTSNVSSVAILDPIDNKVDVSVKPIVKISPVSGATQYTLQLSETSNFTSGVTTLTSASPNIQTGPLKYLTLYYVRAKSNLNTAYGPVSHFTTHDANKYAFVSNPVNQATNVATNNLKVTANIVYGATHYTIELNTNQFFIGSPSIVRTSATSGQRTLTFNGLAPGTLYYSRVKTELTSYYGPVRSFTTAGQPTYLVEPANNQTEVSPATAIRVAAVTGAVSYTLEVSTTSDFSGPVATYTSSTTQFSFGYLSYSTRYYMRARAGNVGPFGQVTTFITHAAEKFSFVSNPVNGAVNVGIVNVPITANITYGATNYTIELNTSSDFTGTSIVRSSAVTGQRTIIFDALQAGTTYYNRTRTNLTSNWGQVRSFTTAGSPPAPAPEFVQENSRVRVYPNPFVTNFTADVPEGNVNLTVFDVTGKQLIGTTTSKAQSMQLGDDLTQGVYILKIQEGAKVTIHRMIKQ